LTFTLLQLITLLAGKASRCIRASSAEKSNRTIVAFSIMFILTIRAINNRGSAGRGGGLGGRR